MDRPELGRAAAVAESLRARIVSGELKDGDFLPRQEDLVAAFDVSMPTLREALRILHSEGLISVRRGNRGGARVHAPGDDNAGYAVGLVLRSKHVPMQDLSDALLSLESVCAGLCAARPDRAEAVLPDLHAVHDLALGTADDQMAYAMYSLQFHELIVEKCGNETLKLLVGALDSLWPDPVTVRARRLNERIGFLDARMRLSGIHSHERILRYIRDGDVDLAQREVFHHLEASPVYALEDQAMVTAAESRARPHWTHDGTPARHE
jgi:DNA-binding FadR family transcriptional regulator